MPDGKSIQVLTITRDSAGNPTALGGRFVMDIDGSRLRPFTLRVPPGRSTGEAFSPDGRRLALAIADTTDPRINVKSTTLYVMNADGTNPKAVATLPSGFVEQLAWSYDSRNVALQRDDARPRPFGPPPAGYVPDANIVVIDVTTGAVRQITRHQRRYLDETPSWSPEGHIYFQSNRTGRMEVYRMNADGSNAQLITK
jgi:Tol biopolymer transport system component